jgi:hypothetical protein
MCRERFGDGSYPALLINSIDTQKMLGLIAEYPRSLVA